MIGGNLNAAIQMLKVMNQQGGGQSWTSYWASQSKVLFFGLYSDIAGGQMPNRKSGSSDYLTVAGIAGSETYQCPNTAPYIAADTDYIWFKTNESQRTATTSEMIGYDFTRTIVKYANSSPYAIEAIMILSSDVDTAKMRDDFDLSIWWDNTLSDYGNLKGNRGMSQSVWTPENVYEAESAALFARFTGTPTVATKNLYNKLILDLKTAGTWSKRDVIVVYCGFDSQASLLNLKGDSLNHALAGATQPSFTAGQYFQGDGTSGYIKTNYIPSVNGSQFTRDSNSMTIGVVGTSADTSITCGAKTITPVEIRYCTRLRSGGADLGAIYNNSVGTLVLTLTEGGIYTNERIDSGNIRILKNGSQVSTLATNSVGVVNKELVTGGYNNNGTVNEFSDHKLNFFLIGNKLSDEEHLAEVTALIYFRDHIVATL